MIKIHTAKDGQFYFTVQSRNHQVIVTSETYKSKQAARRGAASLVKAITTLQVSPSKARKQEFAG
jgi:uncharacterized protein YegP (UPF0339 family)